MSERGTSNQAPPEPSISTLAGALRDLLQGIAEGATRALERLSAVEDQPVSEQSESGITELDQAKAARVLRRGGYPDGGAKP